MSNIGLNNAGKRNKEDKEYIENNDISLDMDDIHSPTDLNSIIKTSTNIKDQFQELKDNFSSTISNNHTKSGHSFLDDDEDEDEDDDLDLEDIENDRSGEEKEGYEESEEEEEQEDIDHDLKVIYKLRILLNECEKLSKKTNSLKLKTSKESSIYQTQCELIDSIKKNKISKQKLIEESQGIDSSTSILYLNKLNEK
ncbi:hypothetical protein DICPUDRAFT_84802 [Dictyostelium purpureum]|uniref:Uncharacterized protein n=1 Tax=Dictyostelium purpureum TaxID=5786 RepID=F1A3S6_DICPU|nr:uncharacterized protein DICPUDRAFT_84802 [Dictyostelium purpureum]EGC29153.1 hypothetical protein DICPUDRAFT_84802 [Dictyostelium purpureum]|eukprot:XP_003294320.1 hypothetical protein DICPUDRAFT_84802 [Dictyostelium purpureum]